MLTASLTVCEVPDYRPADGDVLIDRGESGGQTYQVWSTRDAVYLVRPGMTTRSVLLGELLGAMAFAAPAEAGKGGGR